LIVVKKRKRGPKALKHTDQSDPRCQGEKKGSFEEASERKEKRRLIMPQKMGTSHPLKRRIRDSLPTFLSRRGREESRLAGTHSREKRKKGLPVHLSCKKKKGGKRGKNMPEIKSNDLHEKKKILESGV